MVSRLYTERKKGFDLAAGSLLRDIKENLNVKGLSSIRIIYRYDVEGLDEESFKTATHTVFSEPQTDYCYYALSYGDDDTVFAVEYLPGQFDIRADSCEQCIQLITGKERPVVRTATVYILNGQISDDELKKIKDYIINPVEAREADLSLPDSISPSYPEPEDVQLLNDIYDMKDEDADEIIKKYALSMDKADILFFRNYFKNEEKRVPTITELRVIDTYWSDHCRHTTFGTELEDVIIDDEEVSLVYNNYLKIREDLNRTDKPITLMDIATIGAKYLRKEGFLKELDESEEINACTIKIKVEIDGRDEDYLLLFKNETHNHPTEIEPYGGASTCLGGAIRDPLSGRAYVYQAMRVTGSADPTLPVSETMKGKLPQKKLTVTAANGYSAYGNQIGLATGGVYELYHPGYVAKRMEIGAVIAAAPSENVIRERPENGDIVILLGGKTGRDGCGGATGSSKSHSKDSLLTCGAEVQKGNPAIERKLQRLMRNKQATTLIRRCNDFGAGGVSVAVGELADGLDIDLDKVPKKYDGLDGTELAISESQERMAVVVRAEDKDKFVNLAAEENLDAVQIATVTDKNRMNMIWRGKTIVSLSRDFLSSNGAKRSSCAVINKTDKDKLEKSLCVIEDNGDNEKEKIIKILSSLNSSSQKGLAERFDSTIGASTVIYPFGGKYQATPEQFMASLIPCDTGEVNTASVMSYGFDPYITEASPYHGAYLAVISSLTKIACSGCDTNKVYLTFQEYFERMTDAQSWGKPLCALLGALKAQIDYNVGAIGGKDSMSGTYEDIHVPPTLVSFAVTTEKPEKIISGEFKKTDSYIYIAVPEYDNYLPDIHNQKKIFDRLRAEITSGNIISAYAIEYGGIAGAICKMSFGNRIGVQITDNSTDLFRKYVGGVIIESSKEIKDDNFRLIGRTTDKSDVIINNTSLPIEELYKVYNQKLENVFPQHPGGKDSETSKKSDICFFDIHSNLSSSIKTAKPKVIIPAFPGTNCEYDSAKAFERAGGKTKIVLIRNKDPESLKESIASFAKELKASQILMIPGGFSGADEPDGSGKFITAVLRNQSIKEAISEMLSKDGLILGICNGFQALIKSGLLPYGEIKDEMSTTDATLTFNPIYRHRSMYVRTKITSVKSPWLADMNCGDIHSIPISHGEGRFTAPANVIKRLEENGQIITRYVDLENNETFDPDFNPNFSDNAIEGIISPDGKILGKMGHSERFGKYICKNVPGNKEQNLFKCGVEYFK